MNGFAALDIPPCRRYVVVKATAGFAVCRLILKLLLFYSCLDFTQNLGKTLFLLCIWKKLHISLAAVVANHRKTGHLVFCSIRIQNLCKAPIHLECFTRPSHITTSSISLRRCLRSPNRYQIFVSCNVILYGGSAASKALLSETFQAHYRIGNSMRQKTI